MKNSFLSIFISCSQDGEKINIFKKSFSLLEKIANMLYN